MSLGLTAFLWGLGSALSLPLGALFGLYWRPKRIINASFMAFGAGALIFALTIELFGHVPHYVEEHGMGGLGGGSHWCNIWWAFVRCYEPTPE